MLTHPHSVAFAILSRSLRFICFFAVFFFTVQTASAQVGKAVVLTGTNAKLETGKLVKLSLELPALQRYFAVDAGNGKKQVHIMQYPVAVPADVDLSDKNKDVRLLERTDKIGSGVSSYLHFRSITVDGSTATVIMSVFKKDKDGFQLVPVQLQFKKTNTNWVLVQSNLTEGTL